MKNFDKIVDMIASQTGMNRKEILQRIENKQKELANMISKEGAGYIIAKECAVKLADSVKTCEIDDNFKVEHRKEIEVNSAFWIFLAVNGISSFSFITLLASRTAELFLFPSLTITLLTFIFWVFFFDYGGASKITVARLVRR